MNKMVGKKLKTICLVLAVIMLLQSMPVFGIKVQAKDTVTDYYINVGQTINLKCKGSRYTYKSSIASVAKVTSSGKVKGLKKGASMITATAKGKTHRYRVHVENPVLSQTELRLLVGQSQTIAVKGSKRHATWGTRNAGVALVKNGTITGMQVGTTKITAKVGNKTLACTVKVMSTQEYYAELLVDAINLERVKYGVPPLDRNVYLTKAAQTRAVELARYYSDTRPNKTSCFSAISLKYKWKKASELTARKLVTPEEVVANWAADSDQLASMLKVKYADVGVGVYLSEDGYLYWCAFLAHR